MRTIELKKIVRNLLGMLRKLYMNGRSSILEIFSLPQAKEISRESLLLRTDILRKRCLGDPVQSISFCKFVRKA